jgi:hypothetical protein
MAFLFLPFARSLCVWLPATICLTRVAFPRRSLSFSPSFRLHRTRAVYDGQKPDIDHFITQLNNCAKRLDGEIERMCNKYYQGFIESIDELLKVRQSASELKEMIDEANESLKISGEELTEKMEKLVEFRQIQRNILTTIEALTNCLSVIQMYCKAVGYVTRVYCPYVVYGLNVLT